ncbi:MAG: pepsin-like aspartyl protease, partial [archaeon]|nr:pepsin-like aspartyl protease [archaeon]
MNGLFLFFNILIYILEINTKDLLVIPFRRKYPITNIYNKTDVVLTIKKNDLICEVLVGTPFQKLYLNPKPEPFYSYIINENAVFSQDSRPKDLIEFKSSLSNSFYEGNRTASYYFPGEAYYIRDTFIIGNIQLNRLNFLLAKNMKLSSSLPTDSGVLGFGVYDNTQQSLMDSNFIWNLKINDTIGSYNYFIEYDDENNGKFIIGGEPSEYNPNVYKNKILSYARLPNVGSSIYWGFIMDHISVGDIEIIQREKRMAKIKFDYGYIGVGVNVKDA